MNIRSGTMHPATIGEAISRISTIMHESSSDYAYICSDDTLPEICPGQRGPMALLALGDLCMMHAPAMGQKAAPTAIEAFGADIILHFGTRTFGGHPRPAVLVSHDLEASLRLYNGACLHRGPIEEFRFSLHDEVISSPGRDLPDAILFHLTLTGALSDIPVFREASLSQVNLPDCSQETLRAIEFRLDHAAHAMRQISGDPSSV